MKHERATPAKQSDKPQPMSATAQGSDVLVQLAQLAEGYQFARVSWALDPFSGDPQWSVAVQKRITTISVVGLGRTPLEAVAALRERLQPIGEQ